MDVHPRLMQSDEDYRQLFARYQAKQAEYELAFEQGRPQKGEVEQELARLGRQVAADWERGQKTCQG